MISGFHGCWRIDRSLLPSLLDPIRKGLCDRSPSVMMTVLTFLHEISVSPSAANSSSSSVPSSPATQSQVSLLLEFVPLLVSLLKQINEKRSEASLSLGPLSWTSLGSLSRSFSWSKNLHRLNFPSQGFLNTTNIMGFQHLGHKFNCFKSSRFSVTKTACTSSPFLRSLFSLLVLKSCFPKDNQNRCTQSCIKR